MSNRPALFNVEDIAIVPVKPGSGYRVSIGQLYNRTAMVEIAAVVQDGDRWVPGNFATRFPAKTLRDFARAFDKAADLIQARDAGNGRR